MSPICYWIETRKGMCLMRIQIVMVIRYSIKEIIQNTKSTKVYTDTAPKTLVKSVIKLIDSKEYELIF